ncbi:glutathione binding-like protein [Kordiimonas gwangyangensis]|uniref:glutathione binding-like protein n=1 Tax=Kordiimonas gwangyangensis TaxID=288022 RepID=UPI0003673084|nr:glutathione binding-like protein [Kordiimonas gwangyangensis]
MTANLKPIQLYTLATPNGQKVSIALEEMGLPYEAHRIEIGEGDQFKPDFVAINPNSKIPAIVDPNGPIGGEDAGDTEPLSVMESGAILLHLAERSGKFLPTDPRKRAETIQWLFFQMAGVGPMFGQLGHFYKFARANCDHPYPVERYTKEVKRLLGVLEARLEGRDYLVDEYTIADMATFPWVNCLEEFYDATAHVGLDDFPNVQAWRARCNARPAAVKGRKVCGWD